MADLSGQIVGAGMVGASVRKNAEIFGVAMSTASKIMTGFEKEGKTSSLNLNSERKKSCLIGMVELLRGLLGRITRIRL